MKGEGGFISAKKIIAIHRPLGADLQPLIFRIPRAVFQLFLSPLLLAAQRGERSPWTRRGWVRPSLLSEQFG